MVLSDSEILSHLELGNIVIKPFNSNHLGSNSYDVHLGDTLAIYKDPTLDVKRHNEVEYIKIPEEGFVLDPNLFYLGVTKEYTESHIHVPFLEGKSSLGRLGICIHATAGKGDVGFCNFWTLEFSCHQSVRIYKDMPVGQLIYFEVKGEVHLNYQQKKSAKYKSKDSRPIESMMWKNAF